VPSREHLEELLKADPNDVFLNFGLAMELAKQEVKEPALEQFDRVISLDPDYSAAYHHKGRLLLLLDQAPEAKEVLSQGLAVCHRIGDAHAASEMEELLQEAVEQAEGDS